MSWILKITFLGIIAVGRIAGHGYMVSPAPRNSAWRFGFDTGINYKDNELFCGGRVVQHTKNGGQCGVCGDSWNIPEPRPHERGGQYGKGVITATYTEGQVIPVTIQVTVNHMGYYEFRLCDNNDPNARDSQSCLDEHLLEMADGSGTRYALKGGFRRRHTVHVQLPPEIHCSHCVLQWTWVARNNTDSCPDSIGKNGCGLQQFFVNCADVRILPRGQTALDSNFTLGSEEHVPETPSTSVTSCLKACLNGIN